MAPGVPFRSGRPPPRAVCAAILTVLASWEPLTERDVRTRTRRTETGRRAEGPRFLRPSGVPWSGVFSRRTCTFVMTRDRACGGCADKQNRPQVRAEAAYPELARARRWPPSLAFGRDSVAGRWERVTVTPGLQTEAAGRGPRGLPRSGRPLPSLRATFVCPRLILN